MLSYWYYYTPCNWCILEVFLSVYMSRMVTMSILPTGIQTDHKRHVPYWWIIGGLGVGLALIVIIIVALVSLRSSNCFSRDFESHTADSDPKNSHKFHILRNTSLCCPSGRYICCKLGDWKEPNAEPSNQQMNNIPKGLDFDENAFLKCEFDVLKVLKLVAIVLCASNLLWVWIVCTSFLMDLLTLISPHSSIALFVSSLCCGCDSLLCFLPAVIGTDVFDMEKPLVFTYEEIFSSTDGFSDANLLGNGTYGSVYYGLLRDQVTVLSFANIGTLFFTSYFWYIWWGNQKSRRLQSKEWPPLKLKNLWQRWNFCAKCIIQIW